MEGVQDKLEQSTVIERSRADVEDNETPYYRELTKLFTLYRLANLNARYYGRRTAKFETNTRSGLIIVGALSATALTILLSVPADPFAKAMAVLVAGLAAVGASVAPALGWTEKVKELSNLHFAYSQLFGQLELVITEIRRAGELTSQHLGMARMVHEAFMRVEAMDELDYDESLVNRERAKVDSAFPADYLWTHF